MNEPQKAYKYIFDICAYSDTEMMRTVSKSMQEFTGEDFELKLGGEVASIGITHKEKLSPENLKKAQEALTEYFQDRFGSKDDKNDVVVTIKVKYKKMVEVDWED